MHTVLNFVTIKLVYKFETIPIESDLLQVLTICWQNNASKMKKL